MKSDNKISIITPTTGKDGLFKLIESIEIQNVPYEHILLWDNKREGKFFYPDPQTLETLSPHCVSKFSNTGSGSCRYSIVIPSFTVQGMAYGSSLRSIGLMAAQSSFVIFADDDVWFEENHIKSLLVAVDGKEWAYSKRKIWSEEMEYIGVDEFESVGDSPNRKVPYEMVDNNCMIFNRRLGTSGAVLYRETNGEYNDDRKMYAFLKQYAGVPGKVDVATVNQICPKRLEGMFRKFCTKS